MTTQIELFGEIQYAMINPFLDFMAQQLAAGETEFVVAISSGGGSVFAGLTAYNFLKGCGASITTHNMGHVHSIAVPIFCAGAERKCVPSGRFLIHDVHWGVQGNLSEVQLQEFLDGLRGDRRSIAKILANTIESDVAAVEVTMREGLTLTAEDAQERRLVTRIEQAVFTPTVPIHRFRLE